MGKPNEVLELERGSHSGFRSHLSFSRGGCDTSPSRPAVQPFKLQSQLPCCLRSNNPTAINGSRVAASSITTGSEWTYSRPERRGGKPNDEVLVRVH